MRKNTIDAGKSQAQEQEKDRNTTIETARDVNVEKPEPVRDRAIAAKLKMT